MCTQLLREVEKEATNLLRDPILINTTNPPENEAKAVEYVTETL